MTLVELREYLERLADDGVTWKLPLDTIIREHIREIPPAISIQLGIRPGTYFIMQIEGQRHLFLPVEDE